MTIKAGSGSGLFSQRHGSEVPDPDPTQNIMDPQHCKKGREKTQNRVSQLMDWIKISKIRIQKNLFRIQDVV
jgi:hypothetical protein